MVKCLKCWLYVDFLNLKQVSDSLKMLLAALAVQQNTTNYHIVNMFRTSPKNARTTEKQLKLLLRTYSWYLEKNARLQPS